MNIQPVAIKSAYTHFKQNAQNSKQQTENISPKEDNNEKKKEAGSYAVPAVLAVAGIILGAKLLGSYCNKADIAIQKGRAALKEVKPRKNQTFSDALANNTFSLEERTILTNNYNRGKKYENGITGKLIVVSKAVKNFFKTKIFGYADDM